MLIPHQTNRSKRLLLPCAWKSLISVACLVFPFSLLWPSLLTCSGRASVTATAPPCSKWRSYGSKFTVLKKVLVAVLGLYAAFAPPPQWISAPLVIRRRGIVPPCSPSLRPWYRGRYRAEKVKRNSLELHSGVGGRGASAPPEVLIWWKSFKIRENQWKLGKMCENLCEIALCALIFLQKWRPKSKCRRFYSFFIFWARLWKFRQKCCLKCFDFKKCTQNEMKCVILAPTPMLE